jgi:hypothetical protein
MSEKSKSKILPLIAIIGIFSLQQPRIRYLLAQIGDISTVSSSPSPLVNYNLPSQLDMTNLSNR